MTLSTETQRIKHGQYLQTLKPSTVNLIHLNKRTIFLALILAASFLSAALTYIKINSMTTGQLMHQLNSKSCTFTMKDFLILRQPT